MAGRLNRGDIHLCEFASPDKRRPVLILTKDNLIPYLSTVTAAKITSSIRGVPSEVLLDVEDGMKGPCAVSLHQVLSIPVRRLGPRVGRIGDDRLREVCAAIQFALGCEG